HPGAGLPPSRAGGGSGHRIDRRRTRSGNRALSWSDFWRGDVRSGSEGAAPGNAVNTGDPGACLYVAVRSLAVSASNGLSRSVEEPNDFGIPDRAVADSDWEWRYQGPGFSRR